MRLSVRPSFNVVLFVLIINVYSWFAAPDAFSQGTRPQGNVWIEANDGTQNLASIYDFGESHGAFAIDRHLSVTNFSDVQVTNVVGTILNPHFRFKGGAFPGAGGTCGKSLNPKASCTIVLSFLPNEPGSKRALVRLNYWEGNVPSTSYRPLAGLGHL